ncbi:HD domain-containing protein [Chloroflexota bacterium]
MPTIEKARDLYENADIVHDFDHVLRVLHTAEKLAASENADLEIISAAALLHDVEGAAPEGENRHDHHLSSADFAGKVLREEGWTDDRIAAVQHCILSHRYRDKSNVPSTLEAKILFDADKLDVLGAVGIARVIAYAALAGSPFYYPPSDKFITTGKKKPGEPHSAYHEHLYKLRNVPRRLFTRSAKKIAINRLKYLEVFFKRLIQEYEGQA